MRNLVRNLVRNLARRHVHSSTNRQFKFPEEALCSAPILWAACGKAAHQVSYNDGGREYGRWGEGVVIISSIATQKWCYLQTCAGMPVVNRLPPTPTIDRKRKEIGGIFRTSGAPPATMRLVRKIIRRTSRQISPRFRCKCSEVGQRGRFKIAQGRTTPQCDSQNASLCEQFVLPLRATSRTTLKVVQRNTERGVT